MTQRDPTQAETRLIRAILRWYRASAPDRPRVEVVEAEAQLSHLAKILLDGRGLDGLG